MSFRRDLETGFTSTNALKPELQIIGQPPDGTQPKMSIPGESPPTRNRQSVSYYLGNNSEQASLVWKDQYRQGRHVFIDVPTQESQLMRTSRIAQ
jgi:hypothetical protein